MGKSLCTEDVTAPADTAEGGEQGTLTGSGPVALHGRLQVEGSRILGQHGQPVRLRGMSLFWSQWMPQFWNRDTVRWLRDDWHVSVIRAAMGVEMGGYLENRELEKAKLEAVVDAAIEVGIYVVIDWHTHSGEDQLQEAQEFFQEVARKYGHSPNVIFETYNEPKEVSWHDVIKPYHAALVAAIRQHSPNLILLGTRTWSQEVAEAARDPLQGENLAYVAHFYAAAPWDAHRQALRDRMAEAMALGAALFVSEWGACEHTGDGRIDFHEAQVWQDFLERHHISDLNWSISDKAEAAAALKPGASGKGGWSEEDLTESGKWMRASLRAHHEAASAAAAEVPPQ